MGSRVNNSASNNFSSPKVPGRTNGFSSVYGLSISLSIIVTSDFLLNPIIAQLVGVSILQKNLTSPAFSVLSTVETETVAVV